MLKKIIIGFLCFIILAFTGIGIYIYTLDWNQHKEVVAERFSEITGLKAVIDGDLSVELFPSPTFSARKVRFSKQAALRDPLIVVNEISANVDLMGLLNKKFIVNSMSLVGATINVFVSEKGDLNWSNVGNNTNRSAGNIEVSFNDIQLSASTFSYKNDREQEQFEIPGISASISAPSLSGPYKTNGHFTHNGSEIKFNGSINKGAELTINMTSENASSGSTAKIEGTLGSKAKGVFSFDTKHLSDIFNIVFGENSLPGHYNESFYTSFHYDINDGVTTLDNFNVTHGDTTKGVGKINLALNNERHKISADVDMVLFNLDIIENIASDILSFIRSGQKLSDTEISDYDVDINLKSSVGSYHQAEAKNLNIALSLENNVLTLNRFLVDLPGESNIKINGNISWIEDFNYNLNSSLKTNDLRTLASLFNIDLAKFASADNKKNIFKKAEADIDVKGNANSIEVLLNKSVIDTTNLQGHVGYIKTAEKNFAIADLQASKILLDKYVELIPASMVQDTFENKLVYQLNLLPWNHETDVEARISVASAVYNKIPLEQVSLEFHSVQDTLEVKKFLAENMAGAKLNLSLEANNIYKAPYFNVLTYEIQTNNFPTFASTLNLQTGDMPLLNKKIFASQGALNGSLGDFNLSSVQKFGNEEFAYTGVVKNVSTQPLVDGDLELKTNNFSQFIKSLNIDYSPDIPVTSFSLSSKIKGTKDIFELTNISSHLGANAIVGQVQADLTNNHPKIKATLDFDKFDADRLFNLSKKTILPVTNSDNSTFISKPNLSNEKIDYTSLKSVDFDIKATAKLLIYSNSAYADAVINALLVNGVLNVNEFKTVRDNTNIDLQFILDSNNLPKIQGKYALKSIKLPSLGGSVYELESSNLDAEGNFESLAASQQDFLENLNSRGHFTILGTAFKGWDLDIIKFELEQTQTTKGFQESIVNNLRNGRSIFTKIAGKYDITKGLVTAENIIWESPVANMNMHFDLNLSTWVLNALFNVGYHNASFPDILKFSYSKNMADPVLDVDLTESLARISESETMITAIKNQEKQAKQEKSKEKVQELRNDIDMFSKSLSRLTLDVVRFKPLTSDANANQVYDSNLLIIQEAEDTFKLLQDKLKTHLSDEELMTIDADLAVLKSKLLAIPKILEDNFVSDSKTVFDNSFNKIAWIFNVARNNASYYLLLTDAYMSQINLLDETEEAISESDRERLTNGIQTVKDDMDKIQALHDKVRENYLSVMDTSTVSDMEEHNKLATAALEAMLSSTERMNNKIISSIDAFRAVLNLSSRDYDQFMVYVPQNVDDIDVTQPITRMEGETKETDTPSTNKAVTPNDEILDVDEKKNDILGAVDLGLKLADLFSFAPFKPQDTSFVTAEIQSLAKDAPVFDEEVPVAEEVKDENNIVNAALSEDIISEDKNQDNLVVASIDEDVSSEAPDELIVAIDKQPAIVSETTENIVEEKPLIVAQNENIAAETPKETTSLFAYAKSTFKEILSDIKKTEQNIQSMFFPKSETTENISDLTAEKPQDVIVAETAPAFVDVRLKTNPAIALDFAQENLPEVENEEPFLVKKQKFKRNKENTKEKMLISSNYKEVPFSGDIPITEAPKEQANSFSQTAFLNILAKENNDTLIEAQNKLINTDAYLFAPADDSIITDHKYVFPAVSSTALKFSGFSSKVFYAEPKSNEASAKTEANRYIFALNNYIPTEVSGVVSKRTFLDVK